MGRESRGRPIRPVARKLGALALAGWLGCALPVVAEPPPRLLVLILDSVPYELVLRLTDSERGEEALFQGFERPVPLVSSFPSSSNIAITGMLEPLGVEPSPGYESRFFDVHRNRLRGGGLLTYQLIPFPWRDHFDWRFRSQIRRGFGDLDAAGTSKWEIDAVMEAFLASEKELFFGYVATTDKLAHFEGPEALSPVLEHLDRALKSAAREQPDRPFHTVILSDHGTAGGKPLRNVLRPVQRALGGAGYRTTSNLRMNRDVVFAPMGLVSSVQAFTRPGEEVAVARVLAGVAGVDLCAVPRQGSLRVISARGEAVLLEVERAQQPGWAYRPLTGDPLAYIPVIAELRKRAGDSTAIWFPDDWWFEATHDHRYPDAPYRLRSGFDLTENPASVICSLDDDSVFGPRLTELAAWIASGPLAWTHGALEREASLGVLITDSPAWRLPAAVRFDHALLPLKAIPPGGTNERSP